MDKSYETIYKHYESCLEKYGDCPKGMDWPNIDGMITRFKIMTDLIKNSESCRLLDLGCGNGAFYSYLKSHRPDISYSGWDISNKFIELCKKKYPKGNFKVVDILDPTSITYPVFNTAHPFDYVVMNGIFTVKNNLSFDQMLSFFKEMLLEVYNNYTGIGLAFNVMSKNVDWERDDLFHLSHDLLTDFICKQLKTRNYVIRNDYGLYEYTTYIYK